MKKKLKIIISKPPKYFENMLKFEELTKIMMENGHSSFIRQGKLERELETYFLENVEIYVVSGSKKGGEFVVIKNKKITKPLNLYELCSFALKNKNITYANKQTN